jgi:hypothetical protein
MKQEGASMGTSEKQKEQAKGLTFGGILVEYLQERRWSKREFRLSILNI